MMRDNDELRTLRERLKKTLFTGGEPYHIHKTKMELITAFASSFDEEQPTGKDIQAVLKKEGVYHLFHEDAVLAAWHYMRVQHSLAYRVMRHIVVNTATSLPTESAMRNGVSAVKKEIRDKSQEASANYFSQQAQKLLRVTETRKLEALTLRDVQEMWLLCETYGVEPFREPHNFTER